MLLLFIFGILTLVAFIHYSFIRPVESLSLRDCLKKAERAREHSRKAPSSFKAQIAADEMEDTCYKGIK